MKNYSKLIANYAFFTVILLLATALQCSLWLNLFGWFPAPQIWLSILVFWVLYREFWETVVMAYIVAIVASAFTALPFPHMLVNCLMTCAILAFARRRVYWAGATFYMLAAGGGVIAFFVVSWIIAWFYDPSPIQQPPLFGWLVTLLLTMLVSLPLHGILSFVDRLTEKDHPADAGTGVM